MSTPITPTTKVRAECAVQWRKIRKVLKDAGYLQKAQKPETEAQRVKRTGNFMLILALGLATICLMGCAPPDAFAGQINTLPGTFQDIYTNNDYVQAIFWAEGGYHTQFPYGIRSIKCSSISSCRNICLTTVKHNRKRYAKYGYKCYPRFIIYLASRFAPMSGAHLTISERHLNGNWIRNVLFYLKHPKQS